MILDCIIIEDEPLALGRTKKYVGQISYLNLKGSFVNGLKAIEFLKTQSVDLIFLDIEMDVLNGIEFLNTLSNAPQIIITSAYEKYALKGYEYNISDYLLKPFTFERFLQSVEKVHKSLALQNTSEKDYLFVKTEYRIEKISFENIFYIEGMGDYRCIKTPGKRIMTLQTFGDLQEHLPIDKFCRVHKSYIVAVNRIEYVERNQIVIAEKRIPVSETYKSNFYGLIGFPK